MRDKNSIISNLIEILTRQRQDLNNELCKLNHNEMTYSDKRQTLSEAIFNIDNQINSYVMQLHNEQV